MQLVFRYCHRAYSSNRGMKVATCHINRGQCACTSLSIMFHNVIVQRNLFYRVASMRLSCLHRQCHKHWPGRKVNILHRGGSNAIRAVSPVNSLCVSKCPCGRKNSQGSLETRLVPCKRLGGPKPLLRRATEIVLHVRLALSQFSIFSTTFPVNGWRKGSSNHGWRRPGRRPVHKLMHMSIRKSITRQVRLFHFFIE